MLDPDGAGDGSQKHTPRALRSVVNGLATGNRVVAAVAATVVVVGAAAAVISGAKSDGDASRSPPPTATQARRSLGVSCKLDRPPRPGTTVQMTYRITSSRDFRVGLGAALYDDAGNDHSTGDGDEDSVEIPAGSGSATRPLPIPRDLPRGHYELSGEIWPENRVGAEGAELLGEARCAIFAVH